MTAMMLSMASYANVSVSDSMVTRTLDEFSVTSFYRQSVPIGSTLDANGLVDGNYGQEPSWAFSKMPSIFSFSDNGTEFGYGYFRIRGLDQTRINVTLDGMPWNEAEDFGCYFANSPDIMADANSISVGRGTSTFNHGTSSYGGSVNIESVDLLKNKTSYAEFGGGSFSTFKETMVLNTGKVGNIAVHAKGTLLKTNGYREHSSNNSKSVGFKIGFFPNDRSSIDFLSINGYHRNGQGYIGSTLEEIADNRRSNGCSELEDDNFFQTVNKLRYSSWLGEKVLFTSSAYWNMLKGEYRFDLDNYMMKMVGDTIHSGVLYNYGLTHHMYGGNVAARYYFKDGNVTIGTNVYKFEREHFLDDRNIAKTRNITPNDYYDNRGHKMSYDAFINAKYVLEGLTASVNAQYRHVNFWYRDLLNPSVKFNEKTKWNFLNVGANLSCPIGKYHEVYAKYAISNREPTRSDMFGGNEWYDENVGITTTEAEVSSDIELGWNVATKGLNMNLNFYAMYFEDERMLTGELGKNGLPIHEKSDNSHRIGIEFYADYEVSKNLHLINNSSLSDNKVQTKKFGSKNHVLTPSCTFVQDVVYTTKKFSIGASYRYRGKMYIDANNDHEVKESWQIDVYGKLNIGKFILSGHVNNITNRDNIQTGVMGVTPRYMVDAPTNFFVSLKYMF